LLFGDIAMTFRHYWPALVSLTTVACGGGGGNGGPPPPPAAPSPPGFQPATTIRDIADQSGIARQFTIVGKPSVETLSDPERFGGGLAVVDIDADNDLDIYLVAGNGSANGLFRNDGNNQFTEIASSIGLDLMHRGSGPAFGDIDGDGDQDLFVGSVEGDSYFVMRQDAGQFIDVTATSGIQLTAEQTVSASFTDYDMDGDLDLALAHWRNPESPDTETLWANNGDGTFYSASIASGIAAALLTPADNAAPGVLVDYSFSPIFTDLDNDGDPDLVVAADFNTSQVFRNNGDGTFTAITDPDVIVDDSGMGSAVGDYDNDGDMDWFVTAIYEDPSQPDAHIGNRLYRNLGDGNFEDVSEQAGIVDGGWGWGACMEDFDNDGDLDIFHVNGFDAASAQDFLFDQVRYFESQGDGTFIEAATEAGLLSAGQGRGVACFDSDRDGDLDIFISNNAFQSDTDNFYENELGIGNHYLTLDLQGNGQNTACIGARIEVSSGGLTQVREIRGGNNYVSQNAAEAHFGLGASTSADVLVRWPDGTESSINGVAADQLMTIQQPD
jgi:hypothetical protein